MIREEQRTIYIIRNGQEFDDRAAAEKADSVAEIAEILGCGSMDIYWRDASPSDVATRLVEAGYKIVPRD